MSSILLHNGEFMTLLVMALALGMDAFSLGLGMGMLKLRPREIARISSTIGVFHVVMPLLGMVVGLYLSSVIGDFTRWIGALLLIGLGGQMVWNSIFSREDEHGDSRAAARTSGWGLFLFALSVSLDSLSVGFSLGTFGANLGLAVTLFGICGMVLAALGLAIGGRISHLFGEYGEAIGGAVLIAFGLKFLL
ncbi:putative Mn2+ efflux pump MntP [Tumebacillus permanentifrigoris]|uniref:Putative manganese efflux pump MntP n=1 Tax=Tumebacillus permanentifrigoris TaxID=378543 RepID=A0A316DE24_9BACL|nr:putative Mn2+ efflux pump MntP [Tumebacillus permanentifrigoris]